MFGLTIKEKCIKACNLNFYDEHGFNIGFKKDLLDKKVLNKLIDQRLEEGFSAKVIKQSLIIIIKSFFQTYRAEIRKMIARQMALASLNPNNDINYRENFNNYGVHGINAEEHKVLANAHALFHERKLG